MQSPTNESRPRVGRRSPWVVLTAVAVVCAMTLVLLWGTPPREKGFEGAYRYWFRLEWRNFPDGVVLGLLSVCAVWAALGDQPLRTRIPQGIGAAAVLALIAVPGYLLSYPKGPHLFMVFFLLAVTCATATAIGLLRWYFGWHLSLTTAASAAGARLSVRQLLQRLLVWTASVLIFLGVIRWLVPNWERAVHNLKVEWAVWTLYALLTSAQTLPLVIASVALVLGSQTRKRSTVLLVAIGLVVAFGTILTARGAGSDGVDWWLVLPCLSLISGFFLAACGALWFLRCRGFRLERSADRCSKAA